MKKLNILVCDLEPEKVAAIKQVNFRQYCHDVANKIYMPREFWERDYEKAKRQLAQKKEETQE